MKIKNITIDRKETYADKNAPEFVGKITLVGNSDYRPDIKITIPEDKLQPIVDLLAQVAVGMFEQATIGFRDEVAAMLAGPPVDVAAIEPPAPAEQVA